MNRSRLTAALLVGVVIGALGATIVYTTIHPQYGETTKILEEKRTEALARLVDALAGFGTNIVRAADQ